MTELSQQAQMRLQKMRENYKQSLEEKKLEIEQSWAACVEKNWVSPEVSELKSLVHKLSGSAGLYGFDVLGATAKALDVGLAEFMENEGVKNLNSLLGLMVNLESAFKEAMS